MHSHLRVLGNISWASGVMLRHALPPPRPWRTLIILSSKSFTSGIMLMPLCVSNGFLSTSSETAMWHHSSPWRYAVFPAPFDEGANFHPMPVFEISFDAFGSQAPVLAWVYFWICLRLFSSSVYLFLFNSTWFLFLALGSPEFKSSDIPSNIFGYTIVLAIWDLSCLHANFRISSPVLFITFYE